MIDRFQIFPQKYIERAIHAKDIYQDFDILTEIKRYDDSYQEMFRLAEKCIRNLVPRKERIARAYMLWNIAIGKATPFDMARLYPIKKISPPQGTTGAFVYLSKSASSRCDSFTTPIVELQAVSARPIQFNFGLAHYDLIALKIDLADLTALQEAVQRSSRMQSIIQLPLPELKKASLANQWLETNGAGYDKACQLINLTNCKVNIIKQYWLIQSLKYSGKQKTLRIEFNIYCHRYRQAESYSAVTLQEAKSIAKLTGITLDTL